MRFGDYTCAYCAGAVEKNPFDRGQDMSEIKYTLNPTIDLVTVDENMVYVAFPESGFYVKGPKIPDALQDISSFFSKSSSFDNAVLSLSNKYSEETLRSMLNYLRSKKILIEQNEADELLKFSKHFLEKNYVYTFGGSSLSELAEKFTSLNVAIVGTKLLTGCILQQFAENGLTKRFSIGLTDSGEKFDDIQNVGVTYHNLLADSGSLSNIVDQSDIIIAAFNSRSHSLFDELNKLCLKMNKKWLRVFVDGFSAEVGPLFGIDGSSCYSCLSIRSRNNMNQTELAYFDLKSKEKAKEATQFSSVKRSSLFPLNQTASSIVHAEVMKYLTKVRCSLVGQVISIDGYNYSMEYHHMFKVYECPVCSYIDKAGIQ